MPNQEIDHLIQPWLKRWSIEDRDSAQPWLDNMTTAKFDSGAHLVRADESEDTLFLINQGLVRLYYTLPDGKERNKAFFTSEQVTGPVSAAISGGSAPFSIQALEPTETIRFHYADLVSAAAQSTQLAELLLKLLGNAFIRNEQREAMLLTLGAQERYAWVLEHEAHLVGRVTQFHLASYLGVDAVSLSRIKRQFK